MKLLGLSAGFHDAAAALVVDGQIVAAVEEERLSRIKHDPAFPVTAADACLTIAGITADDLDAVVFHEKPLAVVNRHLTSKIASGPAGLGSLLSRTPTVVREQLAVPGRIHRWFRRHGAPTPAIRYCEHHTSHLAAAYFPSPFRDAAVLAVDGVGEWATCSIGAGNGRRLDVEQEVRFPHSLGLLYSAFASYCGFRVNSGEGELMGLAPFGEPVFADQIREHLLETYDDGSFRLDQRYFAYTRGRRMTNQRFHRLFGGPPRPLGSTPTAREADLAASVQVVTEDIIIGLAHEAHRLSGSSSLALSGGVALNCVANGRLLHDGPFDEVWVQPAAGDAGSAIGAALWLWFTALGNQRDDPAHDAMSGAFLGPRFQADEVEAWLIEDEIQHRRIENRDLLNATVAERLAGGEVVGWFSGRMEFGPRALGHRSILADPRSPDVQTRINAMVKERAAFRPFAPAVLEDRCDEWFDPATSAPYMTFTATVRPSRQRATDPPADDGDLIARVAEVRSEIPAVTHVDHSARIQTVDPGRNPEFSALLQAFDRLTGCPVLLNTSFNARDEPIVCTPEDALRTFRRTGLDLLVIEDCLIEARSQVPA